MNDKYDQTTKKEGWMASTNDMEFYAKNCKIFIDTCSLLHIGSNEFWRKMIPFIEQFQNKIIIPLKGIEELEKHANRTEKPELLKKARKTLQMIQMLLDAKLVEVRGEASDNFTDNVFQVIFTKFRVKYSLLLITQDNDLAQDILALNGSNSVKAKRVYAKRINQNGFLEDYVWNSNTKQEENRLGGETMKSQDAFCICKNVTQIKDSCLSVTSVPKEQDILYTKNQKIKLGKAVASGGEGTIFLTNTQYVAKIYKRENNTKRKYEKIKRMLSKPIQCEGICYPVDELYNGKTEFVGYLMPKAKGKEIQRSLFIKPLLLENFPDWKKRDLVELCITILEKIKYLHDRNIIMGDINPNNILVVSPKEVYFVDTDSYQVEDFPCPVGTINYTAPEIQGEHFADFLRTMGNENFAVATLLFMIMLPGKPPYSQQGGENPVQNIRKMDFSYPLGNKSNNKTPDGPWRFLWSHLTYELKEAFYHTFRKEGNYAAENDRISVERWLVIFQHYLELLDSGKFGQRDPMSEELFPTRYKRIQKNSDSKKCIICGEEAAENQLENGFSRIESSLRESSIFDTIRRVMGNYNQ